MSNVDLSHFGQRHFVSKPCRSVQLLAESNTCPCGTEDSKQMLPQQEQGWV